MDQITLEGLSLDVIVGILPEEQEHPQPLRVDLSLGLDLQEAGETGDLAASVDYGRVRDEVVFLCAAGHWRLLETLALALLRHLLGPPVGGAAAVQEARIALRKPEILDGPVPGVVLSRPARWCALLERRAVAEGVTAEILVETEDVGAYRVHLAGAWDLGRAAEVRVLAGRTDRLEAGGQALWTGERPLEGEATLLVVARPPLSRGRPAPAPPR